MSDKSYIINTGMKLECLADILGLSLDTLGSYSSGRLKIPDAIKKKLVFIAELHNLVKTL